MESDTDKLMNLAQMADYLGVSRRTAERMATQAGFPSRYRIGARCVRWRRSELDRWLTGRAEAPQRIPEDVHPDLLVSKPRGPRRKVAA